MIEDSIRTGRYPFETAAQKQFASFLRVLNRSAEDLKESDITVETRVHNLYVLNNYVANIQHLPGVIELDVLDSFKMICRRLERIDPGIQLGKS